MLSFNQEKKDDLISKLKIYGKNNNFIHGTCGDGRSRSTGRSLLYDYRVDIDDYIQYEKSLGIPEILAYLENQIFENLPTKKAKNWPLQFIKSIPVNTDLSKVWDSFAVSILTSKKYGVINFVGLEKNKSIIQKIANLYIKEGTKEEFKEAGTVATHASYSNPSAYAIYATAAYAAYAVTYAATSYASYAAAYAADAVILNTECDDIKKNYYMWAAKKLIKIIKDQ